MFDLVVVYDTFNVNIC